jgi:hypothetical protein
MSIPLVVAGIGLLMDCVALADEPKPAVSLILAKASAERRSQDVLFQCDISLENATGRELSVRSNFNSAFDGVELVVTDLNGKTLAQQPYPFHQSPFSPPGRDFPLKQGVTAGTLVFPIHDLPGDAKEVKVRLVGMLPGSSYHRILSTETLKVPIKNPN